MTSEYVTSWTSKFSEQIESRLEKRHKMADAKSNPYKTGYKPNVLSKDLHAKYGSKTKEDLATLTTDYQFAGRAMLVRDFGKAAFLDVDDGYGRMQVYVSKNDLSEGDFAEYKSVDYGDFIWMRGFIFRTGKGDVLTGHGLTPRLRKKKDPYLVPPSSRAVKHTITPYFENLWSYGKITNRFSHVWRFS